MPASPGLAKQFPAAGDYRRSSLREIVDGKERPSAPARGSCRIQVGSMITDKDVVRLFLSGYAKATGTGFVRIDPTDERVRNRPAVDAVATDKFGKAVAVEHTVLQPFPGQKKALQGTLEKVFEPLKRQPVPGRNIMITVPDYSVRGRRVKAQLAAEVRTWFEGAKKSFPHGWSYHVIPVLDTEVHMVVERVEMDADRGVISIMYAHPRMKEQFGEAVLRSLEKKIQKLVDAVADRKILLFQREWLAYSKRHLDGALDLLAPRFPGLGQVDEIWLVDSVFLKRHGYLEFQRVRPAEWSSSASFRMHCE